jgi:hypothetical protein
MTTAMTSSLLTGRALEKARFFYADSMTDQAQNPVDGLENPP